MNAKKCTEKCDALAELLFCLLFDISHFSTSFVVVVALTKLPNDKIIGLRLKNILSECLKSHVKTPETNFERTMRLKRFSES